MTKLINTYNLLYMHVKRQVTEKNQMLNYNLLLFSFHRLFSALLLGHRQNQIY